MLNPETIFHLVGLFMLTGGLSGLAADTVNWIVGDHEENKKAWQELQRMKAYDL